MLSLGKYRIFNNRSADINSFNSDFHHIPPSVFSVINAHYELKILQIIFSRKKKGCL